MLKKFIPVASIVIIISLALLITVFFVFLKPETNIKENLIVKVDIPQGTGIQSIAKILANKGVVNNSNYFLLKILQSNKKALLKPGTYSFTTGSNEIAVINALVAGPPKTKTVEFTIPEGYRISQIADVLATVDNIEPMTFISETRNVKKYVQKYPDLIPNTAKSLEGYLFPDTYEIKMGSTSEEILTKMLDRFQQQTKQISDGNPNEMYKKLTIASIIQREASIEKEFPLVSSVIKNRLDKNMPLQMCSTVVYVLNKPTMRLTTEETKTESPYNTYINKGLPPGPIANPGLKTLEAANKPAKTNYIYFVLTGKDGSQTFTTTYKEFLKAKEKSKETLGQ